MPTGPRVRANNVYGTVSDNPLLAAGVSFTSLGLSLLPAISGQHAVIVLDPKRVFGEPEIVVVTSHLAMGTTATITRGAYGTVARDHPQGTAWAHVPVGPDDYTAIVTSGTRPSDPYDGQLIYETDTGRWSARLGSIWIPAPHNVPTCRVTSTASQNITNNTLTILIFDAERYDTDAMHDNAVNNSRITIKTAGVYVVSAHVQWAPDTDYTRQITDILLNGTTIIARHNQEFTANQANGQDQVPTTQFKFAVNDFIEVRVFQQNTGTGTNAVEKAASYTPEFMATWIGVG